MVQQDRAAPARILLDFVFIVFGDVRNYPSHYSWIVKRMRQYPDMTALFAAKKARRARLAALPIEEKMEVAERLRQIGLQAPGYLPRRPTLSCQPDCGHRADEHNAFDAGLDDGEKGLDENTDSYDRDERLIEAYLTGYSVGEMNRDGQAETVEKAE